MPKINFKRCFVPILLLALHTTAGFLPTSYATNVTIKRKEKNGEVLKSSHRLTNVDIDDSYYPELDIITSSNKTVAENTLRQRRYNSLWTISSPVKRSTKREKAKISCSWHPKNSSFACQLKSPWQQIKNEIDENEKSLFSKIKVSKVNFAAISSRHQQESTKTLSLDCGLPRKGVSVEETKEKTQYVQFYGFEGLKEHKKDGHQYNYYDGAEVIRRRKNKSNRKGRNSIIHSWPQLTKLQVINCPLITSSIATAVKKQYNFDGDYRSHIVQKKSLLNSLFLSVFGSVNVPITTFSSTIKNLDLSNNGIEDNKLFTDQSLGNNKRVSRKLLSLECKVFGSRLQTLNLSENEFSLISHIFSDSSCPKNTFVNLREFTLSKNQITRLSRDDLSFTPYLERLYLNKNQIQNIDDAFHIGSRMTVLDLSNNKIPSLSRDFFSVELDRRKNETLQLTELHLQNNSLRSIPSFQSRSHDYIVLPHLVLLNLSRNAIVFGGESTYFNKQLSPFKGLPNLVALDLSYNGITR